MAKRPKKVKPTEPRVHKDLKGFNIHVNESGEIESTFSIDKLNDFLDKNVPDKKLKYRDDLDVARDPGYVPGQKPQGEEEDYPIESSGADTEEETDMDLSDDASEEDK